MPFGEGEMTMQISTSQFYTAGGVSVKEYTLRFLPFIRLRDAKGFPVPLL